MEEALAEAVSWLMPTFFEVKQLGRTEEVEEPKASGNVGNHQWPCLQARTSWKTHSTIGGLDFASRDSPAFVWQSARSDQEKPAAYVDRGIRSVTENTEVRLAMSKLVGVP